MPDLAVPGVEGLFLIGERTRAAKVMGVYGAAQVALAAEERIVAALTGRSPATAAAPG